MVSRSWRFHASLEATNELNILLRHCPRSIAPCRRQQRHGFQGFSDYAQGVQLPPLLAPTKGVVSTA